MTADIIEAFGRGMLILLSVFTAYKYGRSVEKNERMQREAGEAAKARRLRDSLGDPDVVAGVRGRFKR